MKKVDFTRNLSIKKLNPNNPLDTGLIEALEQDELINGKNGYLWALSNNLKDVSYLRHNSLLNSSYAIYHGKNPIGFLEISDIFKTPDIWSVNLCYALHKTARKKGYMRTVLTEVSDMILKENQGIDTITLMIAPSNEKSILTAEASGFISDNLIEEEYQEQGYVIYQKMRK